ncbi:MAG: phage holin family protein [Oscillospiraceae bacterium]|nr:phage holin family protein [Oscillospiraceae bacterium]
MLKYLIMIAIIVGLAVSDWLTGNIKAHIHNDYKSSVMRTGLWHKASEFLIKILEKIGENKQIVDKIY